MQLLALISGCFAVAYTGWTYAPVWGHVLGLVIGFPLGLGIAHWENRAIKVRRGLPLVEQRGALDA